MSSAAVATRRPAPAKAPRSPSTAAGKSRGNRRFRLAVVLIVYLAIMGFGRVYTQTLLSQTVMDISTEESRLRQFATENQKLKVEDVVLRSPARLERYALGRLGMVRPDQVHYITVESTNERPKQASRKGGVMAGVDKFLAQLMDR